MDWLQPSKWCDQKGRVWIHFARVMQFGLKLMIFVTSGQWKDNFFWTNFGLYQYNIFTFGVFLEIPSLRMLKVKRSQSHSTKKSLGGWKLKAFDCSLSVNIKFIWRALEIDGKASIAYLRWAFLDCFGASAIKFYFYRQCLYIVFILQCQKSYI